VASQAVGVEKIEGTLTKDLIGDVGVSHGDVLGFGRIHSDNSLCYERIIASRRRRSPPVRVSP
jgi:hypothetical protein